MIILLSNDDGIDAPGLDPLARALEPLGEPWVVAPATEQSARSHSLTMHKPLRLSQRGPRRFAVEGTPADAVYLAVHHLLPRPPALVFSGINRGGNLGSDVLYSGTVAAAMEACLMGLPAVAISLYVDFETQPAAHHWATASRVAAMLGRDVVARGLPPGVLLNVNVPDRPWEDLRGIRACGLGERVYDPLVEVRLDPRGRPYYWIGGTHSRFGSDPSSDGPLAASGHVTVTPIQADRTAADFLEALALWPGLGAGEPGLEQEPGA